MSTKILIVDDSASDRLIIRNMLEKYETLTAADGIEALDRIDQVENIHLLILDLNMPRMNGFEVLQRLKSEPYSRIRAIILTNYDEIENEIKGLQMGAVDYIRKPIHMDSLKARIDIHMALLQDQHRVESRLYEQDLTFDVVFEQSLIGIAIALNQGPFDENQPSLPRINPMLEQITGRSKDELIRLGWAAITHPDDLAEDSENFRRLRAGQISRYTMDKRYIRPDGTIVWVNLIVAALALPSQDSPQYISLVQDISNRKNTELQLQYQSEHDLLTGLPNRRSLIAQLHKDLVASTAGNRALVGLNLSAIHVLNVRYGFEYTQALIKKIVESIRVYSDDRHRLFTTYEYQYVYYLKDYADMDELKNFGSELRDILTNLLFVESVQGGIGIVEIDHLQTENTDEDLSIEHLLQSLQIASEYKMEIFDGANSICVYDAAMRNKIMRENSIKQLLSEIAEGSAKELLYLQYQPVIVLETGEICGFEALARLKHDKLGLISPLEFIPIAEETKLIIALGDWILEQALWFLRKIHDIGGNSVGISINISAIQLLRENFAENLFKKILAAGVPAHSVGLEITESIFATNYHKVNDILGELQEQGIRIYLDDFGTGYSSLARERELHVDCLKIDKYFISKLSELREEELITGDIISMAHRLGQTVVAEGVETETQKLYLEKHGSDMIQGYLISRPLDEQAAIAFYQSR